MPDRTACKFCGKVGLVRRERVVKAERSIESFYCGACNGTWNIEEKTGDEVENRSREDKPRRS